MDNKQLPALRSFQLRQVQLDAIEGVRDAWRSGQRRALLVLPTGVGKTITALESVRRAVESKPDARVLWLAHREELVTQPLATVRALDHFESLASVSGLVKGRADDCSAQVVFSSVQTMQHRAGSYLQHGSPSLIVLDEAHHYVPGRSWGDVALGLMQADSVGSGGCFALGLTATPERADAIRLSAMWGDVPAYSYSLQEAIDSGYLVEPDFHDRPLAVGPRLRAAIDQANSEDGDDEDKDLAKALLNAGIADHVAQIADEVRGEPTLIFCMDVAQVIRTHTMLVEGAHRAAYLTGKTPAGQRRETLRAFEIGHIDVIVNCGVLTEGTDLPRTAHIVLARPCGSKTLYIQIVGRGARLYPGKSRFDVWDVLGAAQVHSLVSSVALGIGRDDEGLTKWVATEDHHDRDWSAPKGSMWDAKIVPMTEDGGSGPHLQLHRPRPPMAGRRSGIINVDGPFLVSPEGWAMATGEGGRSGVTDPSRKRSKWLPEWIDLPDGVRALGLGSYGTAYTIPSGGQVWPMIVPPRARRPTLLNSRPVAAEIAGDLVAEVGRQAAKIVNREAEWRRLPVTDPQRKYLRRLGVEQEPRNRGHAERLITEWKAAATMKRLGLRRGWTP